MNRRAAKSRSAPLADELRRAPRRRWVVRLTLLAVLVALSVADHSGCLFHRSERRLYDGGRFDVVAVVDGDTLDVAAPGSRRGDTTRVRLWGIDTPETGKSFLSTTSEPFADEATAFTRRLCLGQTVRLHLEQRQLRDKFGRLLAHVELPDGSVLNESLLLAGLASFENRFEHSRFGRYELLEQQAKYDKVGLWSVKRAAGGQ